MYKFSEREFSQREIDAAIVNLVLNIKAQDIDWKAHSDYRAKIVDEILPIYSSYLDNSDKLHDIIQVIDKYILEWAIFEVTCNPNKYCEFINPNDDL